MKKKLSSIAGLTLVEILIAVVISVVNDGCNVYFLFNCKQYL